MSNPRPDPPRLAAILDEIADLSNWVSARAPMGDTIHGFAGVQEPPPWQRAKAAIAERDQLLSDLRTAAASV